jgi:hypothetical protein
LTKIKSNVLGPFESATMYTRGQSKDTIFEPCVWSPCDIVEVPWPSRVRAVNLAGESKKKKKKARPVAVPAAADDLLTKSR